MAKNKRLTPNQLAEERGYFNNLKNIPGYRSQKPEFEVAAIQTVVDRLDAALVEETHLVARLDEVRDIIAEAGTQLVAKNDGAVVQVSAQFGDDSPQIQSLGRKRKSEYLTGRPKKKTPNNSSPA
ncbi:MAG: hypothetical protein JSS81_25080 [Acidobacteria bacterium]|nr:hypothetical protein [Acidobacteriota bacterium]